MSSEKRKITRVVKAVESNEKSVAANESKPVSAPVEQIPIVPSEVSAIPQEAPSPITDTISPEKSTPEKKSEIADDSSSIPDPKSKVEIIGITPSQVVSQTIEYKYDFCKPEETSSGTYLLKMNTACIWGANSWNIRQPVPTTPNVMVFVKTGIKCNEFIKSNFVFATASPNMIFKHSVFSNLGMLCIDGELTAVMFGLHAPGGMYTLSQGQDICEMVIVGPKKVCVEITKAP